MSTDIFDQEPLPNWLDGTKSQKWTVLGALNELVDNAFGEGRGNAMEVRITWDSTHRILSVMDHGRGISDLSSLFKFGKTVGISVNDIGRYGCGGTMAILWLASSVRLSTIYDGNIGLVDLNLDRHLAAQNKAGKYLPIKGRWNESPAHPHLEAAGRGTMIEMELLSERRGWDVSNVQKGLAKVYAPGFRMGRKIVWETIGRGANGGSIEPLADPLDNLASIVHCEGTVEVPLKGKNGQEDTRIHLPFQFAFGSDPDAGITESCAAVSFGPRVIMTTRDCYRSVDGTRRYSGAQIRGWIALGDGWQRGWFTTTKDEIKEPANTALMSYIFEKIEPLLAQAERNKQSMILEGVFFNIKQLCQDLKQQERTLAKGIADPNGTMQVAGRPKGDRPRLRPCAGTGPFPTDNPSSKKENGDVNVLEEDGPCFEFDFIEETDSVMQGQLVIVTASHTGLSVFLNIDHNFVQQALESKPVNTSLLIDIMSGGIAWTMVTTYQDVLAKAFPYVWKHILTIAPTETAQQIGKLHAWLTKHLSKKST